MQWQASLQCLKGPFKSQAHGTLLRQLIKKIFETNSCEDPVWMLLSGEVARDLGNHDRNEINGAEHEKKIWGEVKSLVVSNSTGASSKKERWFSCEESFRLHKKMYTVYLYGLLVWGCTQKRWSSLESSPLRTFFPPTTDDSGGAGPAGPPPPDAGGDHDPAAGGGDDMGGGGDVADDAGSVGEGLTSKAAAARALKAMKAEKVHQLDFAAHIFGDVRGKNMMTGMVSLFEPLEFWFKSEQSKFMSVAGTSELMVKLANGHYRVVYHRLLDRFLSPEYAVDLGLSAMACPGVKNQQDAIIRRLWSCLLNTIGGLESFNLLYTDTFPHAFLKGLRGDVPDTVMASFKASWELLSAMEVAAHDNVHLQRYLRDLVWPGNPMCREVFIGMAECSWKHIPAALAQELLQWTQCQNGTYANENLNRLAHCSERSDPSGKLSAASTWQRIVSGPALSQFERPVAQPDQEAINSVSGRKHADLMPPLFTPIGCKEPFDETTMQRLQNPNPSDFCNLSPESWRSHGMMWQAALKTNGDWFSLQRGWVNLLLDVGLHLKGPGCEGLVVEVSRSGILLLELRTFRTPDVHFTQVNFRDVVGDSLGLSHAYIQDPSADFSVVPVQPIHPADERCCKAHGLHLRLSAVGGPCSILEHGAKYAFKNLKVDELIALWKLLNFPGKRPIQKRMLVVGILLRLEPMISADEIERRLGTATDDFNEFSTCPAAPQDLASFYDEDEDAQLLEEVAVVKKAMENRARERRQRAALQREQAPAADPAGPRPRRTRIHPKTDADWTQPYAKRFLPPGSKISKHRVGGARWTLTCPHFTGSWDRTIGFGAAGIHTPFTALCVLLDKAWKATSDATGVACPWIIPLPAAL